MRDGGRVRVFRLVRHVERRRFERDRYGAFVQLVDKSARIFRPGELLAEAAQAETVVNALIQNAAELLLAFDDEHAFRARIVRRDRGRQTGRPAPDDYDVPYGCVDVRARDRRPLFQSFSFAHSAPFRQRFVFTLFNAIRAEKLRLKYNRVPRPIQ